MGDNLQYLRLGEEFLDKTAKTQLNYRKQMDNLEFIKIKIFCSTKVSVKRIKRQVTLWEKYLQTTYLTKNFYSEYTKKSQNSIAKFKSSI